MTATLTPLAAADSYWAVANDDDLCEAPATISADRCLAWLHDLAASTDDPQLHALVAETITDLTRLGRYGADMEDLVLGALASIEVAFEVRAAA